MDCEQTHASQLAQSVFLASWTLCLGRLEDGPYAVGLVADVERPGELSQRKVDESDCRQPKLPIGTRTCGLEFPGRRTSRRAAFDSPTEALAAWSS